MKAAAIQMNCIPYDKKANFSIAAGLIERACKEGAKLIALPELFNTGYCCYEREWEYAEDLYGETAEFLWGFARKYGCTLIGGFSKKAGTAGLCYNSLMLISPHANRDSYSKMYLWGDEKNRFIKGRDIMLWSFDGITVAPQICYEIGFPENAKIAALKGAQVIVNCAAFNALRLNVWDIATRSRAIETGCYVIAANHSSTEHDPKDIHYCAHSRIVDPKGHILAEATEDNDVITADIDLSKIYEQRDFLPYLRDIDTSLTAARYGEIVK